MTILFNYRPDGKIISLKEGEKVIMVIRRGPRGIVAVVKDEGPIVIWDSEVADEHLEDSEEILIKKLEEILNK